MRADDDKPVLIEERASASERTAATVLWVVVAGALAYGVSETISKVAALFG
ncbi:MAG: MFS transporter small subunit [Actinomycetota bacterium]|nr:hypothetical protein HJG43_13940 [Kineosporiaceae bacterium SCSIO 59966]